MTFLSVGSGRLYYEERGTGAATFLLHGNVADTRMWDDQIDALAARHRVVRYDLRGFGRSETGDGPYSNADDLTALMDHLGIDRAHLVGVSLGACFGLYYAANQPERVIRLVSVSAGIPRETDEDDGFAPAFGRIFEALSAGDHERAVEAILDLPPMRPSALIPDVRARLAEMFRTNLQSMVTIGGNEPALNPPTVELAERIRRPTLVMHGALEFPEWIRQGDLLAASIADSERRVVADSGHMVNMERPDEFNEIVLEFLGRG